MEISGPSLYQLRHTSANHVFTFTHELIESMTDIAGTAWQVNPRNSSKLGMKSATSRVSGGAVNGNYRHVVLLVAVG